MYVRFETLILATVNMFIFYKWKYKLLPRPRQQDISHTLSASIISNGEVCLKVKYVIILEEFNGGLDI